MVRFIWIRQATALTHSGIALDQMNLLEFQAFDVTGTNVASALNGASVTGSSVFNYNSPNWCGIAWHKLIDGDVTKWCSGAACGEVTTLCHTSMYDYGGWFLIDLGMPRDIRGVRIIHRSYANAWREMGAAIELHGADPVSNPGTEPLWRKCIKCADPNRTNSPCGIVHQFSVCP